MKNEVTFFYGRNEKANKEMLEILSNKGVRIEIEIGEFPFEDPLVVVGDKSSSDPKEVKKMIQK